MDDGYNEYIKKKIIPGWLGGFMIMIMILHIWARCKSGRCRIDDY
tara:strand:- start:207 stop:341 length:135 start_codon:yes stop_codon:yes gene_type:complete